MARSGRNHRGCEALGRDVEVNPEMYSSYDQLPSPNLTYVLHTSGN